MSAYFAYSPLIEKQPDGEVAEALDVDLVFDVPSTKWNGRVGAITTKPSRTVFGKLYQGNAAKVDDLLKADQAELAANPAGRLQRIEVQVRAGGKTLTATALALQSKGWAAQSHDGPVSEAYAKALAKAAEAARLPADYVTRLKAEAEILQRVQTFGRQHGLSNE